MLLNCPHRATVHIIPTDIIPSGMRKLSTNKHAWLCHSQHHCFALILWLQMNLLVRGWAEWHCSGCVYADEWSFRNHSGRKLQTLENEAGLAANPNPCLRVIGNSFFVMLIIVVKGVCPP